MRALVCKPGPALSSQLWHMLTQRSLSLGLYNIFFLGGGLRGGLMENQTCYIDRILYIYKQPYYI